MTAWAVLSAGVLVAALAFDPRPQRGLGQRRWLVIPGACLVFIGAMSVRHGRLEARMTDALQGITRDGQFTVDCWRWWEDFWQSTAFDGYVVFGSTVAHIDGASCRDADNWAPGTATDDQRRALMLITHEAAHLVGHREEFVAECVAMWAAPRAAEAFGGLPEHGEAIAVWYESEINPRLGPRYRVRNCLSGAPPESPLLDTE